jgi:protein-tyrosine phosphatase
VGPITIVDGVHLGSVRDCTTWSGAVVDCSSEHRRRGAQGAYQRIPMLDLAVPEARALRDAAQAIADFQMRGPVLVCCGLGLGRSVLALAAWLLQSGRCATVEQAIERIRVAQPAAVLHADGRAALAAFLQHEEIAHDVEEHRSGEGQ